MDSKALAPKNTAEWIIWYALTTTYPLYFLGALYISGPVIAWILFVLVVKQCIYTKEGMRLPFGITLWVLGMITMLVTLIVGHLDWQLGTGKLIKSSVGWAKGWALLALFILAGTLPIRPALLYRAAMVVCLHTLLLTPLFIFSWLLGLPETPYVSPLQAIGGPGPEFFAVSLYEIDPGSGLPRWRLFTPWAPALGFIANIFFLFSLQEQDKHWRLIGISASILMILMSQSRLAAVSLLCIAFLPIFLRIIFSSYCTFLGASVSTLFALAGIQCIEIFTSFWESFKNARADSTRVRSTLANIALQRWQSEAPIWGHGIVERGPHLVEYMPIGSHHSWYGLLFVKGIVGFFALAIPLLFSLLSLGWQARKHSLIQTGFISSALLMLYTFGENLEILAYLIWPALLSIGQAHSIKNPQFSKQICSPVNQQEASP